jgi:FAD/FMN-containing dehydrogenase
MNTPANRADYEEKKQLLIASLKANPNDSIRLAKDTSNLFRQRQPGNSTRLDVRNFNKVIHVAPADGFVEVEGMTPYVDLTRECLKHGVMPTVVPQLKSITIGGAVTGIGIESSSFRYGLVHETVLEMEVLLGDGTTILCTPDNQYQELFYGFPNSYGTLGYVLKLKVKVVPAKQFVRLTHIQHRKADAYFADIAEWCEQEIDFIDGTIFGPEDYYLTIGEFTDSAPSTNDYSYKNIYYRSIRERDTDYLPVEDYIWRWDTDWFWCSSYVFAQNPIVRRLLGRNRLNSITYTKLMRWNKKWNMTHYLNKMMGWHSEAVIQDVEIPLPDCAAFLEFYFSTIRFTPVWTCPIRPLDNKTRFTLYPMDPGTLYVNFGFWNVIRNRQLLPPGHYNRLVEEKVSELGGLKSLYSDSYYTEEQFWTIYNKEHYRDLKKQYDSKGQLKDLYAKCVLQE